VLLDHESRAARQDLCEALDLTVGKLHHPSAAVADQVMAVILRRRGIVPVPVIYVHTFYQSEAIEQIDGAIDAGQTDAQGSAVYLGDLEMGHRCGYDLEDGSSGLCESETLRAERALKCGHRHGTTPFENDSQYKYHQVCHWSTLEPRTRDVVRVGDA
jgi:hypothetical protein